MSEQNKKIEDTAPIEKTNEKVEIIGVNFREAGKIYFFSPGKYKLSVGDKVIVETSRGVELGYVKTKNKFVDS